MLSKKGDFAKKILPLIIIVVSAVLFYLYSQGITETSQITEDDFSQVVYPHYSRLPITYELKNMERCFSNQKERVRKAFEIIQESTNDTVRFKEVESQGNIIIDCLDLGEQIRQFSLNKTCEEKTILSNASPQEWQDYRTNLTAEKEKLIEEGMYFYPDHTQLVSSQFITKICYLNKSKFEYSPDYIFGLLPKTSTDGLLIYRKTTEGIAKPRIVNSVITEATVQVYRNTPECEKFPSIEVHEILHALGFDHYNVPDDIMSPYFENCNQNTKVNDKYVSCLRYIYSNAQEGACDFVNFL